MLFPLRFFAEIPDVDDSVFDAGRSILRLPGPRRMI